MQARSIDSSTHVPVLVKYSRLNRLIRSTIS